MISDSEGSWPLRTAAQSAACPSPRPIGAIFFFRAIRFSRDGVRRPVRSSPAAEGCPPLGFWYHTRRPVRYCALYQASDFFGKFGKYRYLDYCTIYILYNTSLGFHGPASSMVDSIVSHL